jgi:hypothetical protein
VLAILIPAGLLRPEAWLFSGAYLLYLALEPVPRPGHRIPGIRLRGNGIDRNLVWLTVLAVAAPVIWESRR